MYWRKIYINNISGQKAQYKVYVDSIEIKYLRFVIVDII